VCPPTGPCQTTTQAVGPGPGSATVALNGGFGSYSVRVGLQDAAGNVDANQAAGWTITRPAPTPTASPTPAPAKPSPRLVVARPTVARDRRTITVRGSVAPGVTGKVTVTARARTGGRTRTVTRRVAIRERRYSARLLLPSTRWRTARVTVRYAGTATRSAATTVRTVRQRPR
jgi:hypothetical protein